MAITRWYAIFSERSPDPKKLWKSKKDLFRSTAGGATTRLPAGADRWPRFRGGTPLVDWDGWSTTKLRRPKWIDAWLIVFWWLERGLIVASSFWWVASQCFQVLEPRVSRILWTSCSVHIMLWIQLELDLIQDLCCLMAIKTHGFPHFSSLFKHAEAHGSTLRVQRGSAGDLRRFGSGDDGQWTLRIGWCLDGTASWHDSETISALGEGSKCLSEAMWHIICI